MVMLMGGRDSQGYSIFQKLAVKGFLAIRPYMEQIVAAVRLMLGTGFPSFKGEPTIKRLRDRFAPGVNERQAAEWMVAVIKDAHENVRSTVYDEFQRVSCSLFSDEVRLTIFAFQLQNGKLLPVQYLTLPHVFQAFHTHSIFTMLVDLEHTYSNSLGMKWSDLRKQLNIRECN
jgi:hypothetical protein